MEGWKGMRQERGRRRAGEGFAASKRFGQNFLKDNSVLEAIVGAASLTKEDRVLEIGPGLGALTEKLLRDAGETVVVEVDDRLIPILTERFQGDATFRLHHGDILKTDVKALMGEGPFKVLANLPYYITTPILLFLLESALPIPCLILMMQKEVADRILAKAGSEDYGALSVAVQSVAFAERIIDVPPHAFTPQPSVTSTVLRILPYAEDPYGIEDLAFFRRVFRASFGKRRKTLANAISSDPSLGISREAVQAALQKMGIREDIRGEMLSVREFSVLSNLLRRKDA